MSPELEMRLIKSYPMLYKQAGLPMTQTCMCWGMECDDGWFSIIDGLSKKIEFWNECHPDQRVEAVQVKEKYGSLRFYIDNYVDEVEKWIEEADLESEKTCEICGEPGEIRNFGWLKCLCDKHEQERKDQNENH